MQNTWRIIPIIIVKTPLFSLKKFLTILSSSEWKDTTTILPSLFKIFGINSSVSLSSLSSPLINILSA